MLFSKLGPVLYNVSKVKLSACSVMRGKSMQNANKIMRKLIGEKKFRKKQYYYAMPSGGSPEFLEYLSSHKTSDKTNHRLTVLNKVFMRHITDMMATGEINNEICNRGIQISKVNVTATYNQVNIYWLASGTDEDNEIEALLNDFAPKLRHELSQLKVMGVVPKLQFVKDSSYYKYMQVENILSKLDFGDDFEPTPLAHDWKSEYTARKTPEDLRVPSKPTEDVLPAMRMDVFGLNYESIMSKVNISMEHAKAAHRKDSSRKPFSFVDVNNNETNDFIDEKERKKLFKDYFRKKLVERKKIEQEKKRYSAEKILLQEEMDRRYTQEVLENVDEMVREDFDRNDDFVEESNSYYNDNDNK